MDRATAEERTTNDGGSPIQEGLARIGFKADEVEKTTAGNWLRLYGDVFGSASNPSRAPVALHRSPTPASLSLTMPEQWLSLI